MKSLPYFDDPLVVYRALTPLGDAVFLDSGGARSSGRWDIVAAGGDRTRRVLLPASSSAGEIREALATFEAAAAADLDATDPSGDRDTGVPFRGGYIGCLSYELGRRLQGLEARRSAMPVAVINYYDWAVVQDRQARRSHLVGKVSPALHEQLAQRLATAPAPTGEDSFRIESPFEGAWHAAHFAEAFARVKDYISAGDCYQINIGQPFRARFHGDLLAAYAALREVASAPFSAFFPLDAGRRLLCLSPERFLTVDERRVETRPIKGTRPRHRDAAADAQAARELIASEKERAENLMIVDLLRNDIGRYCETGSVQVDELFRLESYATVHHLVSVVSGTLATGRSATELLLGCLPGGSITGAPKRRAMQIIDELEAAPRELWCGSVFYLSRHGRLDSNITIRTLFNEGDVLTCWAGGGLVDDSRAADEFQEQRDKVGAFLACLENL